ncbi:hypothetical protein [Paenibacillus odorifer]|uniref:hypothetical protein n=1 Tax=Paenibacillus odorifer TaxID=189426 RepID=UPI00096E2283|nr:hypothetical protein [Paenibacillus odorifer]OME34932.1 hypothetical protein BSK58_24820 [Paenibacillus odorifer]
MSANGLYKEHSSVNDVFWRELGVRYDAINELDKEQKSKQLRQFIETMSVEELKEFADVTGSILKNTEDKEAITNELVNLSEKKLVLALLLRDFQNRKKKTIPIFYQSNSKEQSYKSPLAQLHHLFEQTPSQLVSLMTYHLWTVRGTGDIFALDKKLDSIKARKVLTDKGFEDALCNLLYKGSKETNKYRIHSYCAIRESRFIGLLYKQVNDTSIADYKQAIRHQEVNTLMFEMNSDDGKVEIKTKVQFEGQAIKKYIENTFEGTLTTFSTDVYHEYDKSVFIETVLNGKTATGKAVNDFLVEKIVFRGSPIVNSPELTLQTKNMDVWSSVMDASEKGCINVESIKDLASISFKSFGVSRVIRSIVQDNGNVIFTMDDSLIEKDALEGIKTKFFEKFGLPIFREIANNKFSDGQADLIDYVMGQRDTHKTSHGDTKEVYDALIKKTYLKNSMETYVECTSSDCPYEAKFDNQSEQTEECPLCDSPLKKVNSTSTVLDIAKIKKEVKRQLRIWCSDGNWIMHDDSSLTFGDTTLKLFRLEHASDQKLLQVLITEQTVDGRLLTKLHKMMTPIIIVFLGQQEKFITKYSSECIQAISFGKLYVQKDNELKPFFDNIFNNLELRAKNYLASAANKSYESICKIVGDPDKIDKKKYTPGDLEDDGFAILKDMFPNSVKWGKQQSGKQLPEGVFSLSYVRDDKERFAFSFDFKMSYKNEGYPLEIGEQRKAVQYVRDLNDSDLIRSYAKNKQLSGHIFISNCFNQAQVQTTIKHFQDQLKDSIRTKPIFINTEVLTYLHSKYRENYEEVEFAKNYYLHWLFQALTNKTHFFTKDHVNTIFDKLITKKFREIEVMDMSLLTHEVVQRDAI